ncbi:hypothetical protein FOA52_014392 [Chlamydomonas sp. UWO 241]|nr:hypothetical protein FOA52_014392 [Chlamydomonas sp. UWO 241]
MSIALIPAHGYVVATVAASWALHHGVLAVKVMSARKKYGVKYPDLYATEQNCKDPVARNLFNCVQRGHQNALENHATFLALLMTAGVRFPVTASIAGVAYLLGRYLYQVNYGSGDPSKRSNGAPIQYGGLFTLLGCVIRFSYELLAGKL